MNKRKCGAFRIFSFIARKIVNISKKLLTRGKKYCKVKLAYIAQKTQKGILK